MTFNYRARVSGTVFVAGVEISKNIIKIRENNCAEASIFMLIPAPTFTPSTKSIFARDCEKNQHIKRIIIKLFIILMMTAASPATFNPSISAYTLMTAVIVLIRKKRHSPAFSEHSIRKFSVHLHRHVRDLAIKGFRTPHIFNKRLLLGILCFSEKLLRF